MSEQSAEHATLMSITVEIVAAHVSHNHVPAADLPGVIETVFAKLSGLGVPSVEPLPEQKPAVSVKKSVTDDHLVCLECGKKFKMLKRHIMTDHDLTPQHYRAKWELSADYPMSAPAYSAARAALAIASGLGRKPAAGKKKKSIPTKRAAR